MASLMNILFLFFISIGFIFIHRYFLNHVQLKLKEEKIKIFNEFNTSK